MPIRHAVLAALFAVLVLPASSAPATGAGTRYEQVGEHYDVSISYPVLRHPAVDADIARIVWKLTDVFRRVAGHGLPPQSAAGPRPGQSDRADLPGRPDWSGRAEPSQGVTPDAAARGAPQTDADVYAPTRRDWLTATHSISRPSDNAVSVIFEVQTGLWGRDGAAVSHDLLAVSYDLTAGRRIELDDLFGDDDCADAVLAAHLRRRNGGGPYSGVNGGSGPSGAPSAASGASGGQHRSGKEALAAPARTVGTTTRGAATRDRRLPSMQPGVSRPAGPAWSETGLGNTETPVTFWLTPRGLMLLSGSCCWQNASVGGSSSVPGNFPVDARRTTADPPPAVEVPIEPLLQCAPHLSYWGRVR
ncbi:hypothetical protein [Nitratidesulfovibrio liaohensis]|uniref:Secreted protein n=1 Tax=Nitratidesulfovibrio liaohensis TaxID=2604158 RepID=A0ABY9R4R8_9BACT|nr:hypothetical protein [Nitratidesulfovibrio liaohensis]WMW66729.1 hypothetical protein KPS_001341 [Nitratidesulfovibrio liaohensis]